MIKEKNLGSEYNEEAGVVSAIQMTAKVPGADSPASVDSNKKLISPKASNNDVTAKRLKGE